MTSKRVSYEQLEVLWDHLNNHKDIAMGFNKSTEARSLSRRLWMEVAGHLNSIADGAIKDYKSWAAYWIDYKGKLKRKCTAVRRAQSRPGGGPADISIVLTDIEKKYLSILGAEYDSGLPGIQVDPFDMEIPLVPQTSNDSPQSTYFMPGTSEAVEEHMNAGPSLQGFSMPGIEERNSAIQPDPISSTNRRRRRCRTAPMSQAATRKALVETSRIRADATQRNSIALKGILYQLSRIASTLESLSNG